MSERTPYRFTTSEAWDDAVRLHPAAVCRVFALGDIHGAVRHLTRAVYRACELRADVVVQVGDFLGDGEPWLDCDLEENAFLWTARDAPLPVVLIGGNDEAWPALRNFAATTEAQAAFASRPVRSIWAAVCGGRGGAACGVGGWLDAAHSVTL